VAGWNDLNKSMLELPVKVPVLGIRKLKVHFLPAAVAGMLKVSKVVRSDEI